MARPRSPPAGDCQQEAAAAATRGSAVIELVYTNGTRCTSTHKPTDSLTPSVFQAIVCAMLSLGDTGIYHRTRIRRVHQSVPDAKVQKWPLRQSLVLPDG